MTNITDNIAFELAMEELEEKDIVLLFSSGLDSFLAYSILKRFYPAVNIRRLYFDLGGRYSNTEISFLNKIYPGEIEIRKNLSMGEIELENAYLPNRNITLVSVAAALYQPDLILINGMKDDRAPDQDQLLFSHFSEVLAQSLQKKIKVTSLFWNFEKSEVIKGYLENNPNDKFLLLNNTYSCFNENYVEELIPIFKHSEQGPGFDLIDEMNFPGCRNCRACLRKICALTAADIYVPFRDYHEVISMLNSVDKSIHPNRYESIVKYLAFVIKKGANGGPC